MFGVIGVGYHRGSKVDALASTTAVSYGSDDATYI